MGNAFSKPSKQSAFTAVALLVGAVLLAGCNHFMNPDGTLNNKSVASYFVKDEHRQGIKVLNVDFGNPGEISGAGKTTVDLIALSASDAKAKIGEGPLGPAVAIPALQAHAKVIGSDGAVTEVVLDVSKGNLVAGLPSPPAATAGSLANQTSLNVLFDFDVEKSVNLENKTFTPVLKNIQTSWIDSDNDGISDFDDTDDDNDGIEDALDDDINGDGIEDYLQILQASVSKDDMETAKTSMGELAVKLANNEISVDEGLASFSNEIPEAIVPDLSASEGEDDPAAACDEMGGHWYEDDQFCGEAMDETMPADAAECEESGGYWLEDDQYCSDTPPSEDGSDPVAECEAAGGRWDAESLTCDNTSGGNSSNNPPS